MIEKNNDITRYIMADLSLDIQRGELSRDNETIMLPKLSYDLLVALAKAAPALLSQPELMAIVWPDRVIGDETLKQRIKLLRKSLGDDASSPVYIEAVRGRGYRLIPQVKSECVIKQPPSVMLDLSANDRFPSISGTQLGSVWRKTSAIGLIIFLIIVISSRFVPSSSEEQELLSAKLSEEQGSTQQASLNNSGQVQLSNIEDANRYYVRGRDYYHRYRKEDNNIAIDLFRRSIAIDSSYSPAYAALSQAFSQKYFQFSGDEEDKQLAIDNAYQALSYDNKSAAAYKALGTAYYVAGWLSKSINILTRGLRIDPSDPEITINLAYIYSEQGNLEKALLLQKSVLKKMPDHAVAMLHVGLTLQRAGKYSDARYWYEKSLSFQPDYLLTYYHLVQLSIAEQNYALAVTYQEKIRTLENVDNSTFLQQLLHADIEFSQGNIGQSLHYYQLASTQASGLLAVRAKVMVELLIAGQIKSKSEMEGSQAIDDKTKSAQQLKIMQQQGNDQYEVSLLLAEIYSARNNLKLSQRYLTQAIEQGYQLDFRVLTSPHFSGLRELPYFQRLLTQVENKKAIHIDDFFSL